MFRKLLVCLAMAMSVLALACTGSSGGGGSSSETLLQLSGEVNISPATATLGATLYANYSGNEDVEYQWQYLDGETWTNINDETNSNLTPSVVGSYRVIASTDGYDSKFSASATITPKGDPDPTPTPDPDPNPTPDPDPDPTPDPDPDPTPNPDPDPNPTPDPDPDPDPTPLPAPSIDYGVFAVDPTKVYIGDALTAVTSEVGVTYQWNMADIGNDIFAPIVDATAATFTPTSTGKYTVTISKEGSSSATSASQLVEARPTLGDLSITPTADDHFVIGNDIYTGATLNADYDGLEAVTYAWTLGEEATVLSTTDSIITAAEGRYTVTISFDRRDSKHVSVQVANDPLLWFEGTLSITPSPDPLEARKGDTIVANYDGLEADIVYTWLDGNGETVATGTTYANAAEGSYTVVLSKDGYHDLKGSITVNPLPQLAKPTFNVDADVVVKTTLELTNNYPTDTRYQWYKDDVVISGATQAVYVPSLVGYYKVEVSAPRTIATTSDEITARLSLDDLRPLLRGNISFNALDYKKTVSGTLTVDYIGDQSFADALTYTWTKNGEAFVNTGKSQVLPTDGELNTYEVAVGATVGGTTYSPRTLNAEAAGWLSADTSGSFAEDRIFDIAYGADEDTPIYVALGAYGKMAWSEDLANWTPVTFTSDAPTSSNMLRLVAYGNGTFIALQASTSKIWRSTDGKTWDPVATTLMYGPSNASNLLYVDNMFITNNQMGDLYYSTDNGDTWTKSSKTGVYGLDYINGRIYIVDGSGNIYYTTTANISTNTFTQAGTFVLPPNPPLLFDSSEQFSFGYGNGVYIAATGGLISISMNGTYWTDAIWGATFAQAKPALHASQRYDMTYANGKIIMATYVTGATGALTYDSLQYSVDGLEWKVFPGFNIGQNIVLGTVLGGISGNSIIYAGEYIVVVGNDGKIVYTKVIE